MEEAREPAAVMDFFLVLVLYLLAPIFVVITAGVLSLKTGNWLQHSPEKFAKKLGREFSDLEAGMLAKAVSEISAFHFKYDSKSEFAETLIRFPNQHENAVQFEKLRPGFLEKVRRGVRIRYRLTSVMAFILYVIITGLLLCALYFFQSNFDRSLEIKKIEREIRIAETNSLNTELVLLKDKVSLLVNTDSITEKESLSKDILLSAKEIEAKFRDTEKSYAMFEKMLLKQQEELRELRETQVALKKLSDNDSILLKEFFLSDSKSFAVIYFWLGIVISTVVQIFILVIKKPFSKYFFGTSFGRRFLAVYDIDGSAS